MPASIESSKGIYIRFRKEVIVIILDQIRISGQQQKREEEMIWERPVVESGME
jgi:hypothetical protein